MDEQKVTLSLDKYLQLTELEIRVNIVVERIAHDEYIGVEDLLWALGTETSVEMAQKMRDEKEKRKGDKNACQN